MTDKKFIPISQKDFIKFLDDHPNLERNTHTICDPIMISYNDKHFWPESMVARFWPDKNEYEIREDYFE